MRKLIEEINSYLSESTAVPKVKKVTFPYKSSYMGKDQTKDVSGYKVGHVAFTKGFGRGDKFVYYHLGADEPFAGMNILPKTMKQATLIADALNVIVPKNAKGKAIGRPLLGHPYIKYRDYVLGGGDKTLSAWQEGGMKEEVQLGEASMTKEAVALKKYKDAWEKVQKSTSKGYDGYQKAMADLEHMMRKGDFQVSVELNKAFGKARSSLEAFYDHWFDAAAMVSDQTKRLEKEARK